MKLVRFGDKGSEHPGLVDADNRVRDLSAHVADFEGEMLAPANLAKLGALDLRTLPLAPKDARLGPPVARSWNFIAVGLNYADHAEETGQELPSEPILFNKLGNSIRVLTTMSSTPKVRIAWIGSVRSPSSSENVHATSREKDAIEHIAGYCICNDVSERGFRWTTTGNG